MSEAPAIPHETRHPVELRVMWGREDLLGSTTVARGSADNRLLPRTFRWAKT